jgi:hypothetical protein
MKTRIKVIDDFTKKFKDLQSIARLINLKLFLTANKKFSVITTQMRFYHF